MTRPIENVQRKRSISNWDAQQLSRFCEVGYQMAKRQFEARLNVLPEFHDFQKEVIVKALMEEVEIIAENLIILALDYGQLDAKKLKQKPIAGEKKVTRGLILTEEVD